MREVIEEAVRAIKTLEQENSDLVAAKVVKLLTGTSEDQQFVWTTAIKSIQIEHQLVIGALRDTMGSNATVKAYLDRLDGVEPEFEPEPEPEPELEPELKTVLGLKTDLDQEPEPEPEEQELESEPEPEQSTELQQIAETRSRLTALGRTLTEPGFDADEKIKAVSDMFDAVNTVVPGVMKDAKGLMEQGGEFQAELLAKLSDLDDEQDIGAALCWTTQETAVATVQSAADRSRGIDEAQRAFACIVAFDTTLRNQSTLVLGIALHSAIGGATSGDEDSSGGGATATAEPAAEPEPEYSGLAHVQYSGKGDFRKVWLSLTANGELTLKKENADGNVLRSIDVQGCSVAKPKSARKGHENALRVDTQTPTEELADRHAIAAACADAAAGQSAAASEGTHKKGDKKYIVSVSTGDELMKLQDALGVYGKEKSAGKQKSPKKNPKKSRSEHGRTEEPFIEGLLDRLEASCPFAFSPLLHYFRVVLDPDPTGERAAALRERVDSRLQQMGPLSVEGAFLRKELQVGNLLQEQPFWTGQIDLENLRGSNPAPREPEPAFREAISDDSEALPQDKATQRLYLADTFSCTDRESGQVALNREKTV
jgi:hypothetical protein